MYSPELTETQPHRHYMTWMKQPLKAHIHVFVFWGREAFSTSPEVPNLLLNSASTASIGTPYHRQGAALQQQHKHLVSLANSWPGCDGHHATQCGVAS